MDPTLFPYSPICERPKLEWPGGARVALWVVPNVEHYELHPGRKSVRKQWSRSPVPDVHGYGVRDYGNRVGIWRLLDVMDKHGITCTASLNFGVIDHYPQIWEALMSRGYDVLCHGLYNTRYHWELSEDEERAALRDFVETYRNLTGLQLAGWFGPTVSATLNTTELVAEMGMKYTVDFFHDDQPTRIPTKHGDLVSIPYSLDVNDSAVYGSHVEGAQFDRMMRDSFDTLYAEGADSGRVMSVCLHPYLYGQPHRIKHLDAALAYMLDHDDVWVATGEQIADWALAEWLPKLAAAELDHQQ